MKKSITYIALLAAALLTQSCVKDLQDDINDGGWNHERVITKIEFENQIGVATIENTDATTGEIELSINVGAQPSMSNVKLNVLETSYQAKSSVKVGESVDLSSGSAKLDIVAATGEVRTYTITAHEFEEKLEGTWSIDALTIYGGTGPEYGGGAVMQLADKPWCWSESTGPAVECDNKLTFTMTGVSATGNTMGTCVNDAGADNKYADFVFLASQNREGDTDIDLKKFYRQIPEGESTWERDYGAGTITFTDRNGRKTVGAFVDSGDIDVGYGKSFSVANNAFQFDLQGTDDWTNIYSDYDKFVKKPRIFWVSVTKVD